MEKFRKEFLEDIRISSEINKNDVSSEFIEKFTGYLIEAEEITEFNECYFEGSGLRNKSMQIDGYAYDSLEKSYSIFISDFSNLEIIDSLTKTQIDKLYSKVLAFIEHSVNKYICEEYEFSSAGYGLADSIFNEINDIRKFKIYIISDKKISDRVKVLNCKKVANIDVELKVWDLTRLFNLLESNKGKESIEIGANDLNGQGIPCILAVDSKEKKYKSYLATISGDVLANIYIKYGARLLEGNVRSFLSIKGKVNKQIRKTILEEPEMFFAFNNGIAATATNIKTENIDGVLKITEMSDLQIINGGQTTASIANAVLQDKKNLEGIAIPMKLSVLNHEEAEQVIPKISRCANSQNKVDEADFFANHPYHIRIEELSRRIYAPAINGNQYETIWFYERARGQHIQEQMKLTQSEKKKYLLKNPKNQLIKKVDLAKYINTYEMFPHIVSKGAQFNMRHFAEDIGEKWTKNNDVYNKEYYKNIIAYAIIFKKVEKLVADQEWYKAIKSYRANIVTYSIAVLRYNVEKNIKEKSIDLEKIWINQDLYKELYKQFIVTTKEVYNFITRADRLKLNVTEWCKNNACWDRAKKEDWTILEEFKNTLSSSEKLKEKVKSAIKEQKLDNEINNEIELFKLGIKYWEEIKLKVTGKKIITEIEQFVLDKMIKCYISGVMPSKKEYNILIKMLNKLKADAIIR
ncbi:MAG: AIPR family protein [Sarcina sp.]